MISAGNDDDSAPDLADDFDSESRRRRGVVISAIAAILLLFLLPVLGGWYYVIGDIGASQLPFRIYYSHHLRQGESIAWSPHLYGGYYLLGDSHIGTQHPVIPLLYGFAPLNVAFTVEMLARYPLAILGAFLLLRRWGLPGDAALFGAATLAFGGFFLMHFIHIPMINVAAHIPWLLLAADVLLRDESPRRARWAWLAVVLLSGSQWLIGFPPTIYMSSQAELIYVVILWVKGETKLGSVLAWVLAKVLGGLVGCAQILPTLETARLSQRMGSGLDFFMKGSLHPADLLQLFSPYWFEGRSFLFDTDFPLPHEMSLYCGSVTTILGIWSLIRWRGLGRLGGWAAAGATIAIIGLLFAMGRYGGLSILQYYLPVVGMFRIPGRYVLLSHIGLAALAAIGLTDLNRARSEERREPKVLWLLLLVPLAQMAWLGALFVLNGLHPPERFGQRALGIAIFLAAFLLVCATSRRVRFAFPLLILFALGDQVFYAASQHLRPLFVKRSADAVVERQPFEATGKHAPFRHFEWHTFITLSEFTDYVPPCPARNHERVIGTESDLNLVRGLYSIEGYASLEPRRMLDYELPAAVRVAGTRWELVGTGPTATWNELEGALPYVRLVAKAVASEEPRETIEKMDLETTAIVSEPLDLPPGDAGTAVLKEEHPGELEITTTAPARRLLVVAESYHPGWWVTLDGQRQHPIRVYGDFLGLVVPEGQHQVKFAFRPWSLRLGPWVSLGGLGLALVIFAGSFLWSPYRASPKSL